MMPSPLQMRAPSWLLSSPDAMLRIVLPSALMTWLRLPSGPRLNRPSFADGAFGRLGGLCLFARNFQSLFQIFTHIWPQNRRAQISNAPAKLHQNCKEAQFRSSDGHRAALWERIRPSLAVRNDGRTTAFFLKITVALALLRRLARLPRVRHRPSTKRLCGLLSVTAGIRKSPAGRRAAVTSRRNA